MEFLAHAIFLAALAEGTKTVPASNVVAVAPVARAAAARAAMSPLLAHALELAATRALAKLRDERCRQVYSDFRDRAGRTLQQNLDAVGGDGAAFFRGLEFRDGTFEPACRLSSIIAFTSPGSRTVYLCGLQFVDRARIDRGFTAALLIHEQLHALGLSENPPSSKEITARVIARCGK